jgi:transcriptional regulator with XRE-family HTH domain
MARKHEYIDKIDKFIGNKIYMLRLAKGLSRQQLSEKIGITHQQLHKYEKGINRIAAGRLLMIASFLEKPVSFFYNGLETENQEELITSHQRLCMEVSRNFMKLTNSDHQTAVNTLIKSLIKDSA